MANSLQKKLRLKTGQRLAFINLPPGMVEWLGPLPEGTTVEPSPAKDLDLVLLFVQNSMEMAEYAPLALSCIRFDGLLWIAYPKKTSGLETDLNRDEGWQPVTGAGYRPVFQIAVDDTWSAVRFRSYEHQEPQAQVDAQYSGKKAALRPIYDRILKITLGLADDITIEPRKSYVAFARNKIFALVKASTMTRIDLGLKVKDAPNSSRLVEAPGFGSGSITHKVALHSLDEVDEQVAGWIESAYEGN